MTLAIAAFGTRLQLGDGDDPELFTTVAEITSLSPGELAAAFEDATSHDSADAYDESIPTTKSLGDTEFACNWIPANASHQAVIAALAAALANWVICYPDYGTDGGVFTINTVTDVCSLATHGFHTGMPVRFTTAGTLPTSSPQIDVSTTYFIGVEDAGTFKVYPTNADAVAGTNAIDFSTSGSGDHTVNAGTRASWTGTIQGWKTGAELKAKLTGTGRIKASGAITFLPAA